MIASARLVFASMPHVCFSDDRCDADSIPPRVLDLSCARDGGAKSLQATRTFSRFIGNYNY